MRRTAVQDGTIAWNEDRTNVALRHFGRWHYVFDADGPESADAWQWWEPGYCPPRMVPFDAFKSVVTELNGLKQVTA